MLLKRLRVKPNIGMVLMYMIGQFL